MTLTVRGIPVDVERIGFISPTKPGEPIGPGYITNDVYAAADGRKFVEVYISVSWREYNEAKDGPVWTEDLWQFVLKNSPKKTIAIDKPAVLRLVPGLNRDNPIVVTFDSNEDAMLYWKTDDAFDDPLIDPSEGYNHLYLDGKIEVTSFSHVDVKHMSHEQLQNFVDKNYINWALGNNWLKRDDSAYTFVCGNADSDKSYCEWVEETLRIKHDED